MDKNHIYEKVSEDVDNMMPNIAPGGFVIWKFPDTVWCCPEYYIIEMDMLLNRNKT